MLRFEPNGTDVLSACHTFQVALRLCVYVYNVLKTSFVSKVVPMQNYLGEPFWVTNFGTEGYHVSIA